MKNEWKDKMRNLCGKFGSIFLNIEENSKEKSNARVRIVYSVLSMFLLGELGFLYYSSGYAAGLNPRADTYKKLAAADADMTTIAAGDIYDRNGVRIVRHEAYNWKGEKMDRPKAGEGAQYKAYYEDDTAYSQIVGYTGPSKGINWKELKISEYNTDFEYRLMKLYRNELYKTRTIDGRKGNSLVLTIDHELQTKVKELLMQEMSEEEQGSAVVLDAKTGEILSMVSFPSFHANDLENEKKKLSTVEGLRYPVSHKGPVAAGSIFKLITAVSLIEHGMEDFKTADSNFTADDMPIVNDYHSTGEEIGYHDALVRSSNVFFAQAALALGGEKFEETAKKFKIGDDIEFDFGTVESNWDFNKDSQSDIAVTAFGQGKTLFSTMNAAMMTQAIANDGVMMKPYLIQKIVDEKKMCVQEGKPEVYSEVTDKETADKVTEAMKDAVQADIHLVEGRMNQEVYRKYSIAGKTGTGETGDANDSNNAWFVSFAPADEPQYVVVVNQCKTEKYGVRMMDTAAGIYEYLFQ